MLMSSAVAEAPTSDEKSTTIKRKKYHITVRRRSGEFHELSGSRKKKLKIFPFPGVFPRILLCFPLFLTPETYISWNHNGQNLMKF